MIDFDEYYPEQVRGEYYVVRHEITSFLSDPKKGYDDVMSFLQQEMPHLRSIRAKLGKTDMFYQKVSSYVVEACLQKIIPAVNDEQSRLDSLGLKYEAPNYIHFRTLKDIAKKSWAAYQIMDKMDMEYMFRYERYLPSRNTLRMICTRVFQLRREPSGKCFGIEISMDFVYLGYSQYYLLLLLL